MNDDELERLIRGAAGDADRPLADLLTRMRQAPGRLPVPSSWLTAVMDGVAVGQQLGPPTPPVPAPRPPRRRWGRVAALGPALKGVLVGAIAAGAVAAMVVAVRAVDRDERLPVRVISPASSSAPAPVSTNQPTPEVGVDRSGASIGVRRQDAHARPAHTAATTEPSSTEPSSTEPSSTEPSSTEHSTGAPDGAAQE